MMLKRTGSYVGSAVSAVISLLNVEKVVIGGENSWQELKECSMVLARYGVAGYAIGAMGVMGPQRMAYGRAISTVRFVAGLMSDMMYEVYTD